MSLSLQQWIVCQLGAREHYVIPRALHQAGQLHSLVTDAWVTPQSWLNWVPGMRSLCDRYHPDLSNAKITAFTQSLFRLELVYQLQKMQSWDKIIDRNNWFQNLIIRHLETLNFNSSSDTPPILFTYSYAAHKILHYAKQRGWRTVLGQIDPGIIEEKIVREEHRSHPTLAPTWRPVPSDYWRSWQEECEIADHIIVNSPWSRKALHQVGVPAQKTHVVPLAYTPPSASRDFQRIYPEKFSRDRPLKVLFLGQIILRKGIAALLDAAALLIDYPIEFYLVGSIGIERSQIEPPNIHWIGEVARSSTATYYREADVFLFPTLSDGFGLTQLEAQAWKLPLIVSKFCGEVVTHNKNGILLPEINGSSIAKALANCIETPEILRQYSKQSISLDHFCLELLSKQLLTSSDVGTR